MSATFSLRENHTYLLGIVVLVVASIFSTGYHHFDEHFQLLEFAGLKLGLTTASNLPWEYHHQMRPALQPSIVYVVYKFLGIENPFHLTFFLRLLSGGLSFLSALLLYKVYRDKFEDVVLKKWFLLLSFTLWFVVYIGVRFSSENWSGIFFVLGFSAYFLFQRRTLLSFFTLGILFGVSFLCRYQAAFLIFGFFSWLLFIQKERLGSLIAALLGLSAVALAGMLIDKWFYGEWTLTAWNYFTQNIVADKVSGFGVEPWWWYILKSIEGGAPPISLLFVSAFFAVSIFKPKNPVIWSVMPFLLIHCMIGHKELRFLFPLCLFIPVITIQGIEIWQKQYNQNLSRNTYMNAFMKLVFVVNSALLLVVMFKPADTQISLYQTLYNTCKAPMTLYYTGGNPYHRVLDIYFYKPENLSLVPIKGIGDVPEGAQKLIAVEQKFEANTPRVGNLVYSTYPNWVMKFNFNNWVERSHPRYIYALHPN